MHIHCYAILKYFEYKLLNAFHYRKSLQKTSYFLAFYAKNKHSSGLHILSKQLVDI